MTVAPRVLYVTPELAPWAKSGGLGEVARDLPRALAQAGADVRLLVPAYPALRAALPAAREVTRIPQPGGALPAARLLLADGDGVPLYLLDSEACYARAGGPYGDINGDDWADNHLRFGLLSRVAALLGSVASPLAWRPQVVHCNDWPCGLAPAWLAREAGAAATVMTVHNLAYQGLFPPEAHRALGLPPDSFAAEGMEFHGKVSFLKAGLYYATRISTVSATYAREIQQAEFGCGLDGLLRRRAQDLSGILNGIDAAVWNPARDPHIAANYDAARLDRKAANKAPLQRELGLAVDAAAPLLGTVARLVPQKGIDLIIEAAPALLAAGAQLVVLGRGERALEEALRALAARHSRSVAVRLEYSEALAHRIEAGADLFLMPSRFEPCGLNQLYSLRYGTPPVARRTGGLADSISDGNTGFLFDEPVAVALQGAVQRALALRGEPVRWAALQRAGMARDSGWDRAAAQYLDLYRGTGG